MKSNVISGFRKLRMNSPNPGAMAGSATTFCVTDVVSRGFETHHTFGVPKRLALKALQKAFVRAEAFESSNVTVLERLCFTVHSLAMATTQMVPVWGSQSVLAFLSSNIGVSSILAMTHFDTTSTQAQRIGILQCQHSQ